MYADPELVRPLLSASIAPTTTSAKPSPLTSPAPRAEVPSPSFAAAPSIRMPSVVVNADRSMGALVERPYTTYADPESVRLLLSAKFAPTMTSPIPSPLKSPILETPFPAWSPAPAPSTLKACARPGANKSTVDGLMTIETARLSCERARPAG